MSNEIQRRCYLDRLTPAERAIYDAAQAVEAMPADVRLTWAGVMLARARELVADYVDGVSSVCPQCVGLGAQVVHAAYDNGDGITHDAPRTIVCTSCNGSSRIGEAR